MGESLLKYKMQISIPMNVNTIEIPQYILELLNPFNARFIPQETSAVSIVNSGK
jgi:hypothetical protein